MSITILVITILSFVIGIYIGCVVFGKEVPEGVFEKQNLKDAPMVLGCQLGQPITVDQMSMDVVAPNLIKIWRHFGKGLDTMPSTTKYAEAMLKGYNPESEYTKLVIFGWLHDDAIKITWMWQKQDPKYICPREAVEGLEKYYEDEQGNPMVLDNKEEKE